MVKDNPSKVHQLVSPSALDMYEALERIANYRPNLVEPSAELKQEIESCQDCKRAKDSGWPPSGLCDHHYGRMSDEVWIPNERAKNTQHIYMRDIATKALAKAKGVL